MTLPSPAAEIPENVRTPLPEEVKARLYSVVLLSIQDASGYQTYLEELGRIVTQRGYKTFGERILDVQTTDAAAPKRINIVFYSPPKVRDELRHDPDFLKIVHLRDESVRMSGVDGHAIGGEAAPTAGNGRVYMVEFVSFHEVEGAKRYGHYLDTALPVMRKYGYHIERAIQPVESFGAIAPTSLVNIVYFESPERQSAFEKDPRHAELEKLYADSVKSSTWYVARSAH